MGSRNSKPQTVRIENPQRDLANNTESDKCTESQQTNFPYGSVQKMPHNWTQAQDVFERKYNELEENQFDKSVEKVATMIGKPLTWEDDVNKTIADLRQELIKCYRDNPKQSLCCADVANKYQNFIFREQFKAILKFHEVNKQ